MSAGQERFVGGPRNPGDTILVAYADMAFSDQWGYWRGTVTGDLAGKAEFHEQPRNFEKDGREYYFEDFAIQSPDGVLRGTKEGVYDLATGDFWDHGRVGEASGRWGGLVGYRVFERARTTTPGVFPIEGHQTPMVLVSPHPGPGRDDRALVSRNDAPFGRDRSPSRGRLTGDLRGEIKSWPEPRPHVIGNTEYFFETFELTAEDGTLRGKEQGMHDRTTGEFAACGEVTDASGRLEVRIGHMVIAWGKADNSPEGTRRARRLPFILVQV